MMKKTGQFAYSTGAHINPRIALFRAVTEIALYIFCFNNKILERFFKRNPKYRLIHRFKRESYRIDFQDFPVSYFNSIKEVIDRCLELIGGEGKERDIIVVNFFFNKIFCSKDFNPGIQPLDFSNFLKPSSRLPTVPGILRYKKGSFYGGDAFGCGRPDIMQIYGRFRNHEK